MKIIPHLVYFLAGVSALYLVLAPKLSELPNLQAGWLVTLKCRMRRRSCAITKKQYSTLKLSVGTVNKSMAAIASRWLLKNAFHSLLLSGVLEPRRIQARD